MSEQSKEAVELSSLIGEHTLDAVDIGSEKFSRWSGSDDMEDCDTLTFRLDGKTYTAIEDPSDGYRSCMRSLISRPV